MPVTATHPGTGRAQGFEALSDFAITDLAIFGNLVAQSFDVVIYSSLDGSTPLTQLASSTAFVGGTGNGWNNIAINFAFAANNFYIVNWRPTVSNSNWTITLDYYRDSTLPVTVGPINLVEGIENWNATGSGNSLHPSFQYNVVTAAVPEPTSMLLMGTGLMVAAAGRRRFQKRS